MKKRTKAVLVIAAATAIGTAAVFGAKVFTKTAEAAEIEDEVYEAEEEGYEEYSDIGMQNRFSGVVESPKTWSVNRNTDYEIEEVCVKAGDQVKEGDTLFKYNAEKLDADLKQAEIDLERAQNELDSSKKNYDLLNQAFEKAKEYERTDLEIRLQEAELNIQTKELEIEAKNAEIEKKKEDISHAEVKSELDGVVKNVNENGGTGAGEDSAFITIMQVGSYRIKGTVNELNIADINEGDIVIAHSRSDETQTWRGTVESIDPDNPEKNQDTYESSENQSTKYPFYVTLENSEGLMLGQHVYLEVEQETEEEYEDFTEIIPEEEADE